MIEFWVIAAVLAGLVVMAVATATRTKRTSRHSSMAEYVKDDIYQTLAIMDRLEDCDCPGLYCYCEDK